MNTDKKVELTKEMKIYLLKVISKGYFIHSEFDKVFNLSLFIGDPIKNIRKIYGVDCDNCKFKQQSKVE